MATKNFTQFSTTTLTTADFIVGYKADESTEFKTTVQDIINFSSNASSQQTLSLNETNKNLTITNGNTVSLSSFIVSDTSTVPAATAVSNIITLTQTQYEAIIVKNPNTIYIIV